MVFIIMGVSGTGKTTVGTMVAGRLKIPFFDADDYHSAHSIEKMRSGIPLDDKDRQPWLKSLSLHIIGWNKKLGAVLACSALKESYRKILSNGWNEDVVFIHLTGDKELILKRMEERKGHYFSSSLLQTQLDTMETPVGAITVRIDENPEEICTKVINRLENKGIINPSRQ